MFSLNKFSLVILTRCNLNCKLCCEYVPQNKPFPDMTLDEERNILDAMFEAVDHITTLHLTGGGEPFLHPYLAQMIDCAIDYSDKYDKLMLFTNSTVPIKQELCDSIVRNKDKIIVQLSQYGINQEREQSVAKQLMDMGINCKIEKYYGDDQSFGGWIDFGKWEKYIRTPEELECIYQSCAIMRHMKGNWRTRDGKVHWCSRSQRGMDLGLIPDNPNDYVDLFGNSTPEEKRAQFSKIANARFLSACDHCSGDDGTTDSLKRFPAAEQIER